MAEILVTHGPAADEETLLVAEDMANLMYSGVAGMALVHQLRTYFPSARRSEVFLAAGIAIAALQSDLAVAEMEFLDLQKRVQG